MIPAPEQEADRRTWDIEAKLFNKDAKTIGDQNSHGSKT